MNKIILIGGAPTTGKSYIAKQLAEQLNLPWISTDQIRNIQKSIADENRYSDLFQNLPVDASVEDVVNLEIRRNEIVWNGVIAFIKGHWPWESCIIEGMAIMPHLAARDFSTENNVQSIFLIHYNEQKIKELVLERSKQPFIKTKTP